MNLLILTDLHLSATRPAGRIGDYVADVDTKLSEIIDIARTYSVAAVLCAGDLFHRPDVSFSAVYRFISFLERLNRRFITIPGSHDLFGNNLDTLHRTAIGILDRLGCIELLRPDSRHATRVGSMSVGIAGSEVLDIELVHGAVLLQPDFGEYILLEHYKTDARIVVVGHYHNGYEIATVNGHTFVCPGSLVRTSASTVEMTRRPRVAIVTDTYKVTWQELVSAKVGSDVLSPPVIVPKLNVTELIQDWSVSAMDNIDAVSLLTELGGRENVPKEYIEFALNYLEGKKYVTRGKDI